MTESVVFVARTVDADTCPTSDSGKVLGGKAMLVTALGNTNGMAEVVVVGASTSTVSVFVVGTVSVVVDVGVVVPPISIDVSEISECLVVVPGGVPKGKEDVAFVVCLLV